MLCTRVVVPLDGSELAEKALPYAEELARLCGAGLHLVRVVDVTHLDRFGAIAVEYADLDLLLADEQQSAREYTTAMGRQAAERGLTVTSEVRQGVAAREILATTRPGDLVAMASHGRGGLARWFLGSVAEEVARRAAVPVLLVRAEATTPGGSAAPATT
jgi:nucleotide-binding universal stress UspA family protein